MMSELETLENELLIRVRDRLINTKPGEWVDGRVYLAEDAPFDAELPYLVVTDGGIDWPTVDKQGQLQVIPDMYAEILGFQEDWNAEDPTTDTPHRIGLATLIGACLVSLYKQDLGFKFHYMVPIATTRSVYVTDKAERGEEMERIAKMKGLRMLARKRITTT